MGIVTKLLQGNDDEIRAVKLRARKDKLERVIKQPDDQLNVNAKEFWPKRNAAAVSDLRLRDQAAIEQEEPYIG